MTDWSSSYSKHTGPPRNDIFLWPLTYFICSCCHPILPLGIVDSKFKTCPLQMIFPWLPLKVISGWCGYWEAVEWEWREVGLKRPIYFFLPLSTWGWDSITDCISFAVHTLSVGSPPSGPASHGTAPALGSGSIPPLHVLPALGRLLLLQIFGWPHCSLFLFSSSNIFVTGSLYYSFLF